MSGGGWGLGPNYDTVAARMSRLNVPRPVQQPKPRQLAVVPERERLTLPQIVRRYALEHDRANGHRPCRCDLCNDLRWHIEQRRVGMR